VLLLAAIAGAYALIAFSKAWFWACALPSAIFRRSTRCGEFLRSG
jgi:hypothetical protein